MLELDGYKEDPISFPAGDFTFNDGGTKYTTDQDIYVSWKVSFVEEKIKQKEKKIKEIEVEIQELKNSL